MNAVLLFAAITAGVVVALLVVSFAVALVVSAAIGFGNQAAAPAETRDDVAEDDELVELLRKAGEDLDDGTLTRLLVAWRDDSRDGT